MYGGGIRALCNKGVQLLGHNFAAGGARARSAIAKAGAIVRTDTRKSGDLRLHFAPRNVTIAQAGIENHRRSFLPHAINVHLVAVDVDELTRHGMETAIAGF